MKVWCGCKQMCVHIHACLEARAGCRQWPLGNQGALCHASLNVWHCVSWDGAWLVYEASKNDRWVMASRGYCLCMCEFRVRACVCLLGLETEDSTWHVLVAPCQSQLATCRNVAIRESHATLVTFQDSYRFSPYVNFIQIRGGIINLESAFN